MPGCELNQACPFFDDSTIRDMPELVKQIKTVYCLGDNTMCARHNIFRVLGGEAIPKSLMPNQHDWAKQILLDAKSPQA
jgi:hypothetical protein